MYEFGMEIGQAPFNGIEKRMKGFGVRVLHSVKILIQPHNWNLDLLSPFWRLYSVADNGAWVECRGERIELLPQRLYLIPSWVPFATGTHRDLIQHYVHFDVAGIPAAVIRAQFDQPIELVDHDVVFDLARKWRESQSSSGSDSVSWLNHVWAGALAQGALARAFEALGTGGVSELERWLGREPVVQEALDIIEQRIESPPSNKELASACGLGVDHFARLFRASTGLTPTQYGLERRVLAASRLLAETDRKIEDVAEATGFNDRFYFSRVFKARLKVTPAVYRRVQRLERLSGIG